MTATASAISPATCPVSPGLTKAMAEESGAGLRWLPGAGLPGEGLGVADGLIAGNRPAALPGWMSWLKTPLRLGIGPSGSAPSGTTPAGDEPAGDVAGEAPAATGICALSETGCLSDTALTVQLAVPAPLAQPLVNVGFWPDGWAVRATVTSAAEPLFSVETRTT